MVHIQTFGYIPSLLFYLGRYFFSTLELLLLFFINICNIQCWFGYPTDKFLNFLLVFFFFLLCEVRKKS